MADAIATLPDHVVERHGAAVRPEPPAVLPSAALAHARWAIAGGIPCFGGPDVWRGVDEETFMLALDRGLAEAERWAVRWMAARAVWRELVPPHLADARFHPAALLAVERAHGKAATLDAIDRALPKLQHEEAGIWAL